MAEMKGYNIKSKNNLGLLGINIYIYIYSCISIIHETLGTTTKKIHIQRGTNIMKQVFFRKYIKFPAKKIISPL